MNRFGFFIVFVTCLALGSGNLVIKEIKGPESIENGTTDNVILDCDYEVESGSEVVLKWFYNGLVNQIYQWIPNHRVLTAGRFKNNIDVSYNVSEDGSNLYRALKIDNITPDMSGNYTCKVSTLDQEVEMTKQLIIYAPSKSGLDLTISEAESQVSCTADGVYPAPHIDITLQGNVTHNNTQEEEFILFDDETGLYNVTRVLTFDNDTLYDTVTFVCNMTIPGTDYSEVKSLDHTIAEETQEDHYDSNVVENYHYTEKIVVINATDDQNGPVPENSAVSTVLLQSQYALIIATVGFLFFK